MKYEEYLVNSFKNEFEELYIYRFENNYGASIVKNEMSYGSKLGLYEIASIYFDDLDYFISYDIFEDVIGYLTLEEALSYLEQIKNYKG